MPKFNSDFEKKVKEQVENWCINHPIDIHWRRFFNIPFGSKAHLETNFISQFHWYKEVEFIEELKERVVFDDDGNIISVKEKEDFSDKEYQSFLDNLDNF